MPFGGLLIAGALGAAGAYAGSQGSKTEQQYSSTVNAGTATGAETTGQNMLTGNASALTGLVGAGPGQSDVASSLSANRSLADMLQQYSQGGNQPNANDISGANDLASKLFGGQRTALNQNFQDQLIQANRSAALSGRDMNDPILRAKLATEQTRQSSMLDANQSGWAAQYATQQPYQRLDFANQRAGILGGLATQAMANRQALASMGEGIMNDERNFRVQTASRSGTQTQTSGGGIAGAFQGGLAGAGAGMSMARGMGGFGGGATQGQAPAAMAGMSTPMTTQFAGASNFMNQINPYSAGGAGFGTGPAPSPFSQSSYSMGSQFGQPRTFSLGG